MTRMTPRERVAVSLNHQEPDRVPVSVGGSAHHISEPRYRLLRDHFGLKDEGPRKLVGFYTTPDYRPLLDTLGTDIRYVHLRPPASYVVNTLPDPFEPWVDEWGLRHEIAGGYYMLEGAPLADAAIQDIENYPWPDPSDPARVEGLREEVLDLYENTDYAIAAHRPVYGGFWEFARWLMGMEQALMVTALDPPLFDALITKLTEIINGFYEALLDVVGPYVQIVEMADDLGTQSGPMISPKLYRNVMKPKHESTINLIKKKAPQARVLLHTDGSVRRFIPDLIEAGFDVINPVQPTAEGMNPVELKAEFGSEMCFLGGVDVQNAMRGSVQDVRDEVKLRISEFGPGGGYVLAPSHNFGDDIPLENLLAFFEAAEEFGGYPIPPAASAQDDER